MAGAALPLLSGTRPMLLAFAALFGAPSSPSSRRPSSCAAIFRRRNGTGIAMLTTCWDPGQMLGLSPSAF